MTTLRPASSPLSDKTNVLPTADLVVGDSFHDISNASQRSSSDPGQFNDQENAGTPQKLPRSPLLAEEAASPQQQPTSPARDISVVEEKQAQPTIILAPTSPLRDINISQVDGKNDGQIAHPSSPLRDISASGSKDDEQLVQDRPEATSPLRDINQTTLQSSRHVSPPAGAGVGSPLRDISSSNPSDTEQLKPQEVKIVSPLRDISLSNHESKQLEQSIRFDSSGSELQGGIFEGLGDQEHDQSSRPLDISQYDLEDEKTRSFLDSSTPSRVKILLDTSINLSPIRPNHELSIQERRLAEEICQAEAQKIATNLSLATEKINEYTHRIKHLEEGVVLASKAVAEFQRKLASTQVAKEAAQSELSQLNENLSLAEQKAKENEIAFLALTKTTKVLHQRLADAEDEAKRLQAKVDEYQEKLAREKLEAETRIAEGLAQTSTSIKLMTQKLKETQLQTEQLQSQKDELLRQFSEKTAQLQAKVDEHQQELVKEKSVAETRAAQLDEKLAQATALIASTNQQLREAKIEAEQLQSQAAELSSQLSERTAQLQAAETRIAEGLAQTSTSIELMTEKLKETQLQTEQLQSQKDELLRQFSEKTAQLQAKVDEHQQELVKEKSVAETRAAQLDEELAQATALIASTNQQLRAAKIEAERFQKLHAALSDELSTKTREHKEEVGEHKALLTQHQSEYESKLNIAASKVDELNSELKQHQDNRLRAQMAEDDSKRKNIAGLKTLGYSHDDNLAAHNQFKKVKELFFEARKNSSLQLARSSDIDALIAKLNELSVQFKNDTGIINSYTQTLAATALCLYGDGGETPFHRLNNLANGRYYQNSESDELAKRIIPEKARSPFLYLLVGIVLVTAVIAAGIFLLPASMTSGVVSVVTANLNNSVPAIVAAGASVLLTGSFFHKPEAPRAAQARAVCNKLEEERNRARV